MLTLAKGDLLSLTAFVWHYIYFVFFNQIQILS